MTDDLAQEPAHDLVFLLDVDNTLLDNDRFIADLHCRLETALGAPGAERYWALFEALRSELGYADYLGALQRYRIALDPGRIDAPELLQLSGFMLDYPFADCLYPRALETVAHLGQFGPTVILSDGDIVFQPRKLQRSGLWDAVEGRALIYVHKEQMLDAVQRRYPARRYVMVDDKQRILTSMKALWLERLTTVFVRQGHYALEAETAALQAVPDFTIERIDELAEADLSSLIPQPTPTS